MNALDSKTELKRKQHIWKSWSNKYGSTICFLNLENVTFLPSHSCILLQYVGLQNLAQRNEKQYGSGNAPSGGVALPFILVQVLLLCLVWRSFTHRHTHTHTHIWFESSLRTKVHTFVIHSHQWTFHLMYSFGIHYIILTIKFLTCRLVLMLLWRSKYRKICSWFILILVGKRVSVIYVAIVVKIQVEKNVLFPSVCT